MENLLNCKQCRLNWKWLKVSWTCICWNPFRDVAVNKNFHVFSFKCLWSLLTCMNFDITSCFFWSSLVGRPISFWRWSYIIFSTKDLVSPSKSESFDGSGLIFLVDIAGSEVISLSHHDIWLIFSNVMTTVFLSIVQSESSVLISAFNSPSMMGGWFLSPSFKAFLLMTQTTSRDLRLEMLLNGTRS